MISRFLSNRRGNVAMITALAFLPLLGAAGLAVDYVNLSRERTNLQAIADAAVLMAAGISLDDESVARREVDRYISSLAYADDLDWDVSLVDGELQLSINRTIPLRIASVLNAPTADIGVQSFAKQARSVGRGGLELALVLDVSNSMKNRMPEMKLAANRLIDEIYGTEATLPNVRVSLVPFSGRVNFVDYGWDWMSDQTGRNVANAQLRNPKKDAFSPSASALCSGWRSGTNGETDASPTVEKLPMFDGPHETCPQSRMIALTESRAVIQDGINALTNNHGTSTQVGLLWGWRSLSPDWQGHWFSGNPDLPLSYEETPGKHVVIMTDGKNHPKQAGDEHTEDEVNAQLIRQCQRMRDQGYTIYAVTYYMNGTLTDLYTACTGVADHVYDANSASELSAAFEDIGGSLVSSALRLTR
ncbi:hypothetical protein GCM10007908_11190 [Rhizobium albus]|nr:hypothetical protein GCM10007908_11190 [Rhizobium albus]